MKDTRLVIVGGDDGYLQTLEQLVKDLGIGDSVLFTGFLQGEIKLAAYVDADVYILPSIYECFPTTVMEACACGTPVIITDACQIASLVQNNVGLVVPGDKDRLREALARILTDSELRARLAGNTRALVADECSMSRYADRIEAVYERVLSEIGSEGET